MKKIIKYLGIMLTAALLCIMLIACGGGETNIYNFSNTTIEGDSIEGAGASGLSYIASSYEARYKGSHIEIIEGSKESYGGIKWTMQDNEVITISYHKEGDKYILSGDYVDHLASTMWNVELPQDILKNRFMWGAKTNDGFKIVMEYGDQIVLNFTKA